MTRTIVPALVLSCTVGFAQTPDTAKQAMKGMTPDTVTVTGCVAEGSSPGQFMLNNASTAPDAMKKEGAPGTTAATRAMTDKVVSSYTLVGGTDLKAHVGHKVEVRGAVTGDAAKTEKGTATDAKTMSAPQLKVESVKMVSTTCP